MKPSEMVEVILTSKTRKSRGVKQMVETILSHISEKPWSDYTEADYSIEQWHNACLVHLHTGPPTSKSQCKLPVKTPNGALSRNGVHAAAAALAGARSPLKAPPEQKTKAAGALRRYYSQLGETPPDSLKQSDLNELDQILEHHGVKGMKWGHRKNGTESSDGVSKRQQKKIQKSDTKFTKKAESVSTKIELHNSVHDATNAHISKINEKYKKAIDDGTLLKMDDPVTKRYHKEVMDSYIKELNNQAKLRTSKSGNLQYSVHQNDYDFLGFTITTEKVKHADDGSFKVLFVKDSQGRVIGFKLSTDFLAQSAIDDILEHHGVRGMKWGVRRDRASRGPQKVTVREKRIGKGVKTSGGGGHRPHSEAVRVRRIGQQGKKSGLHTLSDKELQDYAKRIQLEQNVKRLQYTQKNPAQKFVAQILGQTGKNTVQNTANEVAAQQVKKHLVKAALLAA